MESIYKNDTHTHFERNNSNMTIINILWEFKYRT